MQVRALAPFGAELTGFDAGVSGDTLRDLAARHRVLVLRGHGWGNDRFIAMLEAMGELTFTTGEQPVDGAERLNLVTNVGRTRTPRSVFHTDTSYVPAPPAYTALRAVEVPRAGGATLFSDQAAVAAGLPARVRRALEGRTLLHSYTRPDGVTQEHRHPVLCRHPISGETTLYLSTPERCSALSGVDAKASKRIVKLLYRRSTRPGGLYRHRWQPGDIVLWDDRLTMHKADHSAVDGDRTLHRGLVAGEPLLAA